MEHLNVKHLYSYLKQFGLSEVESKIYILLATEGPFSALQLAKETKLPRTQVYRYLEVLVEASLVNAEKLSYGTLYSALELSNLEAEIESRVLKATKLHKQLPLLNSLMKDLAGSQKSQKTTVKHYYGLAGIKQANWNLSKATKEFRVFEQKHLNAHLNDPLFTKRLKERFIEKGLKTYDLTNSERVNITDIEPINLDKSKMRHISPSIIEINFEVYVYDSTITLLDYTPDRMMAVEVNNPSLSKMMAQVFDAIWAQGKDIEPS
jgi:sugar-specific transcriptional regulator TrmB